MSTPGHTRSITAKTSPSSWDQARVVLSSFVGALLGVLLARQDLSAGQYVDRPALILTFLLAVVAAAVSWASAPALIAVGAGAVGSAIGWELLIPLGDPGRPLVGASFSHFGIIAGSAYLTAGLVIVTRHHERRDLTESSTPKLLPSHRVASAVWGLLAGVVAAWVGLVELGETYPLDHVGGVVLHAALLVAAVGTLLGVAVGASRVGGGVMAATLVLVVRWAAHASTDVPGQIIWPALACAAVIVSAVASLRSEDAYAAPTTTLVLKAEE